MTVGTLLQTSHYLAWRDDQLVAISAQLEDAMPALLADLDAAINAQSTRDIARGSVNLRAALAPAFDRWKADQLRIAVRRADQSMSAALRDLPPDLADPASWADAARIAVPAAASLGMIAASLAAIPTVVSFATVSTSALAIFSTSAVSIPLLLGGIVAIGATSFAGFNSLGWVNRQLRANYQTRMRAFAYREVLGFGAKAGSRCVMSDIQAVIIKASQSKESMSQ